LFINTLLDISFTSFCNNFWLSISKS